MTFDDLMRKVLTLFPDAELGEDNDGQIVIYTDMEEGPNGIRKFVAPEDSNEEEDQVGNHVFKGSSVVDDCSLCGQRYAHGSHR